MAQKKAGDEVKAPETKVVEPKVEEVKTPSPQEELDGLRQQLKEATEAQVRWEEEAKAHQKVVSKKDQELQEAKQIQTSIDEIKGRTELLEAFIAELGDKTVERGEGETGFAQKMRASQLQRQREAVGRKASEVSDKVDELLKDTGLTKQSPELKTAGLLYSMGTQTGTLGHFDDALNEVKEVVAKLPPKVKAEEGKKVEETEEQRIDRLADTKKQAWLIEHQYVTPEGGEPSAGGAIFTREQIKNMSSEEFEKNKPAIDKARKEGRIK